MNRSKNTLGALLLAMFAVGSFQAFAQTPASRERSQHMKIRVGTNTFSATLENSATATALKALLPMTVNMTELNGNEKYFRLGKKLPTNASNPKIIHSGDLMLYGDNTVVLFYKTFSTSYDYTRLGRIKDMTGLAAAVGAGSVTVTFELE
jgi:hypothetical protein